MDSGEYTYSASMLPKIAACENILRICLLDENVRLSNPIFAFDMSFEIEPPVEDRDICHVPSSNLLEALDAEPVELLFDYGANAFDQGEVVVAALFMFLTMATGRTLIGGLLSG